MTQPRPTAGDTGTVVVGLDVGTTAAKAVAFGPRVTPVAAGAPPATSGN